MLDKPHHQATADGVWQPQQQIIFQEFVMLLLVVARRRRWWEVLGVGKRTIHQGFREPTSNAH